MKASELDKGLKIAADTSEEPSNYYYIHPQQIPIYEEYSKVGQTYERSIHDRTWDWWVVLVTSDPVKDQEIRKVIPQIYRTKDYDGKEWLFYNVDLYGNDWKGNRKDFSYIEGMVDRFPLFNYEVDPSTNAVIAGTTQVLEVTKRYSIPYSKAHIDSIAKYFKNPLSAIVVAPDNRRYSVNNLEHFKNMNYNELIEMATGFGEFMKNRRGTKMYS
jgi:hypothetical protein